MRPAKDMDQECDCLVVDVEIKFVAVGHDGVGCKKSAAIRMVSQYKPRLRKPPGRLWSNQPGLEADHHCRLVSRDSVGHTAETVD